MHSLEPSLLRAVAATAAAVLWNCAGTSNGPGDGNSQCKFSCDGGNGSDAADAGPAARDAGKPLTDGGKPLTDGGDPLSDGGDPLSDGGDPLSDGGDPLSDGGCAGTSSRGEKLPLDMYIMLDQSGSMGDPLASGSAKWKAVTDAINSFLGQPGMEGMSVGLQYFPLPERQCPSLQLCSQDSDCTCGPCLLFVCAGAGDSCDPAVYAAADVEISPISSAGPSIAASIARHNPSTATPTSAALKGAIDHARAWAADPARSQHVVIVVLATDGEPTECDIDLKSIDAIAAAGAGASPKIRTFVIGVGSSLDKLNEIARSGDTDSALIVDTSGNVNAQFLEALNKIRGAAVGCNYLIPIPPSPQVLNFDQVNVTFLPATGATGANAEKLVQVRDAAACGSTNDSWYYDDFTHPKQIVLCPSTCSKVEASGTGGIDVVLGCQTNVGPN